MGGWKAGEAEMGEGKREGIAVDMYNGKKLKKRNNTKYFQHWIHYKQNAYSYSMRAKWNQIRR